MKVHFWDVPEYRNYIILKKDFKERLVRTLEDKKYPWKIRNKIKNGKISIIKLKKISEKENISLIKIEKNILWIGGNNSKGLNNPNFPINFDSRNGARFIAGIINDGTLTVERGKVYGRLMYDNFDKSLRESIIKDYLKIFGGKTNEIAFRNTEKKKYLEFSSVVRDIVELVIKQKGPKCESNIELPLFVFNSEGTKIGWIEQTIADEGEVKYFPKKYRRAIVWRRSLDVTKVIPKELAKEIPFGKLSRDIQVILEKEKFNLIEAEKKILDSLKIEFKIYNLGIYTTINKKIRTRWQINIAGRKNLLNLRKLIKIPSKEKDDKFTKMIKGFVRYKEPLKIKDEIVKLGKEQNSFTSTDLKKKMNYKRTNTAIKWIKIFENQKLIKKIKESTYGNGDYRKPAKYKLILNK